MPAARAETTFFGRLARSEQASSLLLILGAVAALILANSSAGPAYERFWHQEWSGLSLIHWVNDALMAVFFLLIGLELKRELNVGALSTRATALLPLFAAIGGMVAPAAIHYALNAGAPTERGFGIPMATDIAFTLGVLSLLGTRVPISLRVFVVAFAVIDDLGAILVIALAYSQSLSWAYLGGAAALWVALYSLNRFGRVRSLAPYLVLGALLWLLTLRSGIHATLAGVLLAFAIPFDFSAARSPGERLEHSLKAPVAWLILPLFALANAGVVFNASELGASVDVNSVGIFAGLVLGKPLGIVLACALAGWTLGLRLPAGLSWSQLLGAGMLGGIGFTMSIFITNLAFGDAPDLINASKLAILCASLISAATGWAWLRFRS